MGVCVAWVDPGTVSGRFAEDLVRLIVQGALNGTVTDWTHLEHGPILDRARNILAERFLATQAEWLLMLDTDMGFSPDLIDRLLETADAEERPVVGALCFSLSQEQGVTPTVYDFAQGRAWIRSEIPTEPFPADGTGTAVLLIHRTVFTRLEELPWPGRWFDRIMYGDTLVGEDLAFCLRLHALNIPVWIDPRPEVKHWKLLLPVTRQTWEQRPRGRFIVTGTGRSGTGYMAELLKAAGVPCGHERVYGPGGAGAWSAAGEASWMAAPYLNRFDGPVIHALRNPLHIVRSLVGIRFFTDPAHGAYQEFARRWCPQAFEQPDEIEAACRFVVDWTRMIRNPAMTVKVENPDLEGMLRLVGGDPGQAVRALEAVPRTVNHRIRADLEWADMTQELRDLASEEGYDVHS